MKFPETLSYRCPVVGCDDVLQIPSSAQLAPSSDPRYAGFMVILELDVAWAHFAQKHGVDLEGGDSDVPDITHQLEPVSDRPADPPGDH